MQTLRPEKVYTVAMLAGLTNPYLRGAFEFIAIQAREIHDLRERVVALEREATS